MNDRSPGCRPASEQEVLRQARELLERRRFYGVSGVGLTKTNALVLDYRGAEVSREIPIDTFAGLKTALEAWIDRKPGALLDAIEMIDAHLPCVACKDDVPFCVACGGKGHDRKHRDGVTLRPLLWHRTSLGGAVSYSDGSTCFGKASDVRLDRSSVTVVVFTDDPDLGETVVAGLRTAGYKARQGMFPNPDLNIKYNGPKAGYASDVHTLLCDIAGVQRGSFRHIEEDYFLNGEIFVNLESSALLDARSKAL